MTLKGIGNNNLTSHLYKKGLEFIALSFWLGRLRQPMDFNHMVQLNVSNPTIFRVKFERLLNK